MPSTPQTNAAWIYTFWFVVVFLRAALCIPVDARPSPSVYIAHIDPPTSCTWPLPLAAWRPACLLDVHAPISWPSIHFASDARLPIRVSSLSDTLDWCLARRTIVRWSIQPWRAWITVERLSWHSGRNKQQSPTWGLREPVWCLPDYVRNWYQAAWTTGKTMGARISILT